MSNGLVAAEENGKWGYVDRGGKWLITPQFDSAGPFNEKTAMVSLGYRQNRLIDHKGAIVKAYDDTISVDIDPNPFGLYVATVQSRSLHRHRDGRERLATTEAPPSQNPTGNLLAGSARVVRRAEGPADVLDVRGQRLATFECGEFREIDSISLSHSKHWSVLTGCDQTWLIHDGQRAFRSSLVPSDVQVTASHALVMDEDSERPTRFELFDTSGKRVLTHAEAGFDSHYDSIVLVTFDAESQGANWQRTPLALVIDDYKRVAVLTADYRLVKNAEWEYDSALSRHGYAAPAEQLQGPLPLKTATGWGAVDETGKWVVPARYSELANFRDGVAFARNGMTELVVDRTGREIALPESGSRYERAAPGILVGRSESGALVRLDLATGTSTSHDLPEGTQVDRFHGGLASARDAQDRHGLIDPTGRWVVPATYTSAFEPHFPDGTYSSDQRQLIGWRSSRNLRTDAGETTLKGWVDATGVERIAPQFDDLRLDSAAQLLVATRDSLSGVFALDGTALLDVDYSQVSLLGDGWFAVTLPEQQGLIGPDGEWRIKPGPLYLSDLHDRRFRQRQSRGEALVYDAQGRIATRAQPLRLEPDEPENWWPGQDVRYGSDTPYFGLDFAQRLTIPGRPTSNDHFSEGLLTFTPHEPTEPQRLGLVNTSGKVIGLYPYSTIEAFRNGLAAFEQVVGESQSQWGYLGRDGKVALPPTYETASDFSENRAVVVMQGNLGLIDNQAKLLLRSAWLCGRDPLVIDGTGQVLWPATAREVRTCN